MSYSRNIIIALLIVFTFGFATPSLSYAAAFPGTAPAGASGVGARQECGSSSFRALVACGVNLLNRLVPIIIVMALIYILWGLANFIGKADNEGEKEKAKNIMIFGIAGLVVMVSVWAIVNIALDLVPLDNAAPPEPSKRGLF
ncbi:MAG: hypothetical protein COV07_01215 [Candidatus Vogelbacteria bacterium CG10_big_fil_rev_8_21_14_0_10_45_14]|uniref:Uncharacterized protein n=1 Tax=Candidatus Vogelbacteria bacterium CG10_big_fil_rev_8_21_14_0_10_45_14 TaxID=1975042 RepID=A0A2H0RKM1_9BACT|nr:MAG: hypothetical protein COV07_01215 [Candidatus Vogelbacteria bacterium CG10_big_fil_rev_8_21_14_0_10_45_14]